MKSIGPCARTGKLAEPGACGIPGTLADFDHEPRARNYAPNGRPPPATVAQVLASLTVELSQRGAVLVGRDALTIGEIEGEGNESCTSIAATQNDGLLSWVE